MIERYGCESRTIATRGIKRVSCQTLTFDGREDVEDFARFDRIAAGEGLCRPCYASARGDVVDDLRRQDDVENETSASGRVEDK